MKFRILPKFSKVGYKGKHYFAGDIIDLLPEYQEQTSWLEAVEPGQVLKIPPPMFEDLPPTPRGKIEARVLVAIPNIKGNDRYSKYLKTVVEAAEKSLEGVDHEIYVTPPEGGERWLAVVNALNGAVVKTLKEKWDYLWLIDGDTEVPPWALKKLYALDVDLANGFYPLHANSERVVVGFLQGETKHTMKHRCCLKRSEVEGKLLSGWVCAGSGCVLIKRRVFEGGLRFDAHQWHGCSFDVVFMWTVQRAGYVAKVHGGVECGHLPQWPLDGHGKLKVNEK